MRILIDNGNYHLRNFGDIAMLRVLVDRLVALAERPELWLITTDPARARELFPEALPVTSRPPGVSGEGLVERGRALLRGLGPRSQAPLLQDLRKAAGSADALVMSGCGLLNDLFPEGACQRLARMRRFIRRGRPVAVFGQGIGPVTDPELLGAMRRTLPAVDLIGLREGSFGTGLLRELGVPVDRVLVTGDDAIEYAHERRPETLSPDGLGFSLRDAPFAPLSGQVAAGLRSGLDRLASLGLGPVHAIPITLLPSNSDVAAIERVTGKQMAGRVCDTLDDVIASVQRCRLVVSGTYHAAVFALAMGIPVIGLYGTEYYRMKLQGLLDQYGPQAGCTLDLSSPHLREDLVRAAHRLVLVGASEREGLLRSSVRQIQASRRAYARFATLLGIRHPAVAGAFGGPG